MAGGRCGQAVLWPVQIAVGARQRVHGDGSVHGPPRRSRAGLTIPDFRSRRDALNVVFHRTRLAPRGSQTVRRLAKCLAQDHRWGLLGDR